MILIQKKNTISPIILIQNINNISINIITCHNINTKQNTISPAMILIQNKHIITRHNINTKHH